MKKQPNPGTNTKKRTQHDASNTLLIIMLMLIPCLHKPVSGLQGSIRIIFEGQRAAGLGTPPLTINLTAKDGPIPMGCAFALLLLLCYVRSQEGQRRNETVTSGMTMDDEEVKAAWNEVKRLLSEDDNEQEG